MSNKFKRGDKIVIEAVVTAVHGDGGYEIEIMGDNPDEVVDVGVGIEEHAGILKPANA